jgi:hypothetical protein
MWREILVGQQDSCDAGTSASPIFHVELYVQLSLYCMPDELADGTLQILSGAFLEPICFVKLHPKSTNPHRFGAVSIVRVAESTAGTQFKEIRDPWVMTFLQELRLEAE